MTLSVAGPHVDGEHLLADRLPLVGITAEPREGSPEAIEVMLGDSTVQNIVHVVRRPTRVRVAQVGNGEDDQLTIETASGETARVDFDRIG